MKPFHSFSTQQMNQFVQRIVNYVANEILIKGLANSKTFQRFAVRTDQSFKEVHKKGTERLQSTLETFLNDQPSSSGATKSRQPPIPPQRGMTGFMAAFFKEVRKDWSGRG
jgi:hypothetical protein